MFLDPDPRRNTLVRSTSSSSSTIVSRNSTKTRNSPVKPVGVIKRKPLQERTRSEINQQTPRKRSQKSTVRLVQHSPSPTRSTPWTNRSQDSTRICEAQEVFFTRGIARERAAQAVARRLSFTDHSLDYDSSLHTSLENATPNYKSFNTPDSRRTTASSSALSPRLPKLDFPPKVALFSDLRRFTTSSGEESNIFTIPESESTFASSLHKSDWLSDLSTLRDTPPIQEKDVKADRSLDEPVEMLESPVIPQPRSPTRRTGRYSSLSEALSFTEQAQLPMKEAGPVHRDEGSKNSGGMSIFPHSTLRAVPASPVRPPKHVDDETEVLSELEDDDNASSAVVHSTLSSPIIKIYDSDTSRPQTSGQQVRYMHSIDSIDSRLQYPSMVGRTSGPALTAQSSWATFQKASEADSPAPLRISRKRRVTADESDSEAVSNLEGSLPDLHRRLTDPSIDLSEGFSISRDSRNDHSPSAFYNNDNWEVASGSISEDSASLVDEIEGALQARRYTGTTSNLPSRAPGTTSSQAGTEAGDMTLGIYREESAKPQPLFRHEQSWFAQSTRPPPTVPLPPVPMVNHDDEHDDTLMELQPNGLHNKRSARSLRHQRSYNLSERSRPFSQVSSQMSMVDSDRLSVASSVFPGWAKQYYAGRINLLSASKVSLARPRTGRDSRSRQHERSQSQWTSRSLFSGRSVRSRNGTGRSTHSGSQNSARYLPQSFRERFGPRLGAFVKSRYSGKGKAPLKSASQPESPSSEDLPASPDSPTLPQENRRSRNDGRRTTNRETWRSDRPTIRRVSSDRPERRESDRARFVSHSALPFVEDDAQLHHTDSQSPKPPFKMMETPRLTTDKRASRDPGIWQPPSFVGSLDNILCSQVDRQVILFMLGFLCPFAWMLAATLPIPPESPLSLDAEKHAAEHDIDDSDHVISRYSISDMERRMYEDKQHAKGVWWRTLNRFMSCLGVLIIAAVIAIAIVAKR